VSTFSGLFIIKRDRPGVDDDDAPYLLDNYRFENVFTNAATGAWFTISGNGMSKDLHIERVSGTVVSIEFMKVGQPIVVRDMNGELIFRDRGHLRWVDGAGNAVGADDA
jgi:hypothetical protein